MNKTGSVKFGILWNSLQQFGQLGITFVSTIILARLLTPEDYGIYGILMIFISVSEMLADSGIAGYIIKKQNVTPIYYDTLFVYNMCVSGIMYLFLFFSAPFIADFYEKEMLISVIRILGLVLLLHAFSITQFTRLLKDLQFHKLALISIVAGVAALCVALLLAYRGLGIWALIFQQLVLVALTTILYLVVNRRIPHFRFGMRVFKEQFAFGINLFGSSVLMAITNNIGNNIIAKIFSMNIAGLYVQAVRLQNYPLSMVSNVVDKTFFPIFSKMNDDWRLLKEQICKLRRLLYAVLFPLFSAAICFAKPIVSIVLGEKWLGSVSYFQILMLASFPLLVKALNRNVLKSFGFTAVIFRIEVYSAVLLLFCLFMAFLFKSILVVLLAVVLGQSFSALFSMFYLKKKCALELRKQLFDILVFFPCAIIPALLQYIVSDNVWIQMSTYIVSFLAMIVFYSFRGYEEYLRFYRMGKR